MKRLDRYIARAVIGGSLAAVLIIVAINFVFEFVDESGNVGGDYTMWKALLYVLLITPYRVYEAFPIATLLGSLMALGNLAARSELIAMRAAGVSVFAVMRAVLIAGVILAVAAMFVGEWVAPRSQRLAEAIQADAAGGGLFGAGNGGFWFRDGDRYVQVTRAPEPKVIEGVTIYRVDDGRLVSVTTAPRGQFARNAWVLTDATVTHIGAAGVTTDRDPHLRFRTSLRPEMLDVLVVEPETLPLTDLTDYIAYLRRNGLDSARYRLAFWIKLVTPLATLTMLVLTIPLSFGSLRTTGAGQRIFVGVLLGLAFFLLNRLLNRAGLVYGMPPALSALAPTFAFLAAGIYGITRVR